MIYDITPIIDANTEVWPGDLKLSRVVECDMLDGDNYTLSSLHTTVHIGAHADAPSHYVRGGKSIAQCSLLPYLGECQVIRCNIGCGKVVRPEHVLMPIIAERVLIYTGTFSSFTEWNNDFAALSVELIDFLHSKNVALIGIDTPSVDLFVSTDLAVHNQIAKYNMAILEGIDLSNVPGGKYELIALPLKLNGFDASPVRAILRTLNK